jgi:hypothetical protein
MTDASYISIDQNCHPLWDTVPKLEALAAHGWQGVHCIEDIDVAFSRQGALPGDTGLALLPERTYRGGHSDWGAALFAHDLLGRLPLDVRTLEPYTGRTTAALARFLETSVDGLYERWAGSDNWQLVGPSYAADPRWHRLIGDVRLAEAGPFVLQLLDHARADLLERFPESGPQQRLQEWFAGQRSLAATVIASEPQAPLTELYRRWLLACLGPSTRLALTSERFALRRLAATDPLLRLFLERYAEAADAYNTALQQTATGMTPLHVEAGELPFFVTIRQEGRLLRSAAAWRTGAIEAAGRRWPLTAAGGLPVADLERDGVVALAGKALLLVLQARLGPEGATLALPHLGSLYMPAAYAFERILRERGLLREAPRPVIRVRFRFLEHWRGCRTLVRPPAYLCQALGIDEAPATVVGEALEAAMVAARRTLEALRDSGQREGLVRTRFAAWSAEREALDAERRQIAADPQQRPAATALWQRIKEIDRRLAAAHAEWVLQLLRLLDVAYYDSRGALLPWCTALEGEALYRRLIAQAEIIPEGASPPLA